MKLYINKQIVKEQEKGILYWFTGEEGVSYSDINAFLENVPQGEPIDVELYSCGGDCTEGFAIYDALRTCGHDLTTTVVGECASMATIIALCAPKNARRAYKHARFLIHEPFYPDGVQGEVTLERAEALRQGLEDEKAKMVAIYVERTEASEADILAQIDEGKWFDADRAIELGFISEIVPETSASVGKTPISTTIKNDTTMSKKNDNEAKSLWQKLGNILGLNETETPVALTLNATDGTVLTIERDEGDIQVGDKASPDGTFTLEDGRTITIQDGVVTEIKEPEPPEEEDERDAKIAELESEIDTLKKQLEESNAQAQTAQTNAKTADEVAILKAVEALGGMAYIKTLPVGRVNLPTNERPQGNVETNVFREMLNEKKK